MKRKYRKKTIKERIQFEMQRAVKSGDCLLASCYTMPNGYASIGVNYKNKLLHRLVLEQKLGRPIKPDEVSRHSCHVKNCINPDHLSVGTQADNIRDKDEAGRTLRGEQIHQSILKETDIQTIRDRYASGEMQRNIAKDYGVCQPTISLIVNGITWKHTA